MKTYELITHPDGAKIILRSDGAWIPLDPRNSDYAEYLRYTAWVEAGNNPEDFWTQDEALLTEEEEE